MSSTLQPESISTAPRWRRRIADALELVRTEKADDFSVNLLMTMSVFAVGVLIEKLIVVPYLARQLNDATLGAILLGRNATVVLSGGISSGLLSLLLRHNQDWEGSEKVVAIRSAVILSLMLSAVVTLFALVALMIWNKPDFLRQHAMAISSFVIWGTTNTVTYILQTYWRMLMRIPIFSFLQLSMGLALLIVIPFHHWFGEAGIYGGFIFAGVAPLLLTLTFFHIDSPRQPLPFWRAAEAWSLAKRMWVFVWGTLCQSLLQNTDRFIIGYLIGTAAVGAYFKATSAAYMILVPVEPVAALILSMASQERLGENTRRRLWWLHLLTLAMMISALIGGLLFGKPLTDLLYGVGTFESGKALYTIVLVGCCFSIAPILLRGMLVVHVASSRIVWIDTLSLLFIALSSLVLVNWYGLIGAAAAAALSMVFRAVLSEAAIRLTFRRHSQQGSEEALN